jgi:hypothetical protein
MTSTKGISVRQVSSGTYRVISDRELHSISSRFASGAAAARTASKSSSDASQKKTK